MNPTHNNPFGVIQGMGRNGQEPQYHSVGAWNGQAWSVHDNRFENFTIECYDQGWVPLFTPWLPPWLPWLPFLPPRSQRPSLVVRANCLARQAPQ
jgi:hypothetical protein